MSGWNRRQFLGATGTAVAASGLAGAAGAAEDREKIRIGMCGLGNRGTVHLKNLMKLDGVEVTAICDLDPRARDRARRIVEDAGRPTPAMLPKPSVVDAAGDRFDGRHSLNPQAPWWRSLLERDDVDAVVSALPCDLHHRMYLDTLAAGKDLYGEKPMCITVRGCDEVVEAAGKSDRVVQIGYQRRSDPRYIQPMELVHGGELGTIVEGRIVWSNSWGPLFGWKGRRVRSGDWMLEQAVHNWDVINWALQARPIRAMGMGRNDLFRDRQRDRDVHDYYAGMLEYPGGVFVNVLHSWVAGNSFNKNYTRLFGTDATIDFKAGTFSYRPRLDKGNKRAYERDGETNSSLMHMQNFLDCVRTRQTPNATVEHGRDGVLAGLLSREAVYTGRPVTMEELLENDGTL
jgi:predicted dehydrogenase